MITLVTWRCCNAVKPVIRLGRIFRRQRIDLLDDREDAFFLALVTHFNLVGSENVGNL